MRERDETFWETNFFLATRQERDIYDGYTGGRVDHNLWSTGNMYYYTRPIIYKDEYNSSSNTYVAVFLCDT